MFINTYREHPTEAAPKQHHVRVALGGALLLLGCVNSFAATSPIVGAIGGAAFTDTAPTNQQLNGVAVRSNTRIISLQGLIAGGTLPPHGGTTGTLASVTLNPGEYLTGISGKYNLLNIGQLSFRTNTGRAIGPFGTPAAKTPLFNFNFNVPNGNAIAGFTGRASATQLNAIGVIYYPVVVTPVPDLTVSIAQPSPAFSAGAMSEIPVTITNLGTAATTGSITMTMPLPTGTSAPLKFAANADAWLCLNNTTVTPNVLTCNYNKALTPRASTTLRLPITAGTTTLNKQLGPFTATVAPVAGETNTANNTSAAMFTRNAVRALNVRSIIDPNYSFPLLRPTSIPKYASPLPNLAAAHFVRTPDTTTLPGFDFYNVDIKQIRTQSLPAGFPATNVYAYGDPAQPNSYSYPAHTIAARSTEPTLNASGLGKPVKIQFSDSRNAGLAHLLPVDHSIHGAMSGEPDIRSVAHVHGAKRVDQNSDGYPEAWRSPNGKTGSDFLSTAPKTIPYNPNPFLQPNDQESTLLWYHDHTLGMTRLNVYAGMAGAYVLRDDNEMRLINGNLIPNGAYEIPLVLQDRSFKTNGDFAYPDLNPAAAPPNGVTLPNPSIVPEFFGNVMLVNGVAWPYLNVEPRRYRFRILNGSSSRFYTLRLSNGATMQVISTEGGFLNAPVNATTLTVGPAERYDVIIDFSNARSQNITLRNSANVPFPNGAPITRGVDDQIMRFRVNQPLSAVPNNAVPANLQLRAASLPTLTALPATNTRQVLLAETVDEYGRILPSLGTPAAGILSWMKPITENPKAGSIETWEIFNDTVDAHPIHLHGGHFQVIDRQNFTALPVPRDASNALTNITLAGAATLPAAHEKAWKDTVISYPGQVTRIRVKFEISGLFVWHCHILEHEDHDMMRPMEIIP